MVSIKLADYKESSVVRVSSIHMQTGVTLNFMSKFMSVQIIKLTPERARNFIPFETEIFNI